MSIFQYQNGELCIEGVSVQKIADTIKTPFYCYSQKLIRERYEAFSHAAAEFRHTICFAVKANANLAVLKVLADLGAGADIVSGDELLLALKAGIPANKIVFSGVGKTEEELSLAVEKQIKQINIESESEALMLGEIAERLGKKINIALRVNPDVDARTHQKMTTGTKENKFGIEWDEAKTLYKTISRMKGLNATGIDMHIGAQMTSLEPVREAFEKLAEMIKELSRIGVEIKTVDVGGGLGIPYKESDMPPSIEEYIAVLKKTLGSFKCDFIFEPGRFLLGEAGLLISKVIHIKKTNNNIFAIVDAGMNDLIRPALYDAWHGILPVKEPGKAARKKHYTVVGPICESSDVFAKDRPIPALKQNDLIAFETAGAYGSSMSSNYNMHPLADEVLVNGQNYAIVRKRQTLEEMIARHTLAPWQS